MKITTALLTAACIAAMATSAIAQTPAAPAVATPAVPSAASIAGPPIPGVCVFDQDELVATSAVGKAVQTRMRAIIDQTSAEINTAASAIETERNTLSTQVAANGEAAMGAQIDAFNTKVQALLDLRNQRGAEVEQTTDGALNRIMQEAAPLMAQAFQQRSCSILFDAAATAGYNSNMNITPLVVQLLDAKIQTFNFDRAVLTPTPQN